MLVLLPILEKEHPTPLYGCVRVYYANNSLIRNFYQACYNLKIPYTGIVSIT